ncbi:PREDICTED: uncharacterized protein LOC108780826 [Cyphomyrmex costatus]|uniref:uncharacterized protein LOC108780826 n=1 Tax=Cyphomyrmex costatus TaxID=456900 RepID=UPI0008523851|nr:PREDICTED: uncharacterized protein LOC108780826 [Cyphomyrmex costatus]
MHAGCCIKVPPKIKSQKAVVNVRSKDNACFGWSVVAALYPAKNHVDRTSSYPHYTTMLNLDGIEFPMKLKDISKFERLNDSSINVYGIENENILPLRRKEGEACEHAIHTRCLHYFSSNEKLESHSEDCGKLNKCAIRLPSEDDKWLAFRNYCRKEKAPFIVYADLECVLKKTEDASLSASSYAYQQHEVFSIGYYVRCSYDDALSTYRFRRDNDCVSWFARQLEDLAHRAKTVISASRPMDFTRDDWQKFNSATHCHICERPFAPCDEQARDHCHCTGRYRGPAHKGCNINYTYSFYILVVFHNLLGYDAHFLIKEIATAYDGQVDLLPLTKEKYISFTKHVDSTKEKDENNIKKNGIKLRFIDSYKFLSASLDKLVSYLDKEKLKIVRSEFSHLSDEDFNPLTRKGVFPYEYVDCFEKLDDTRLPPRESFHSSLTGDTVSESDYAHAANVWQRFSVRTLSEYSDLYLKTDVLLLADVFENFRDSCVASYGLDPAHYYTLPDFTWNAMLKHTRVKFELLTDIHTVMFIERGIHGGLSQCSGRYTKVNNKYMRSYDSSKPSSYLGTYHGDFVIPIGIVRFRLASFRPRFR